MQKHIRSKLPNFLILLFFTQVWERFSYYGMRALLVLFLVSKLGFTDAKAFAVYSLFAALSYASPVVGGIIADKLLGLRSVVVLGGIVITLGHILLSLLNLHDAFVYLGLGTIAIGTGLFKGNLVNLLGACYAKDDATRDGGFTIFHVGVNLGAFLAPIICGVIAHKFGWHYGFGVAAIGMTLGLIIFVKFQHVLGHHGLTTVAHKLKLPVLNLPTKHVVLVGSIVVSVVSGIMLYYSNLFAAALKVFGIAAVLYLAYLTTTLHNKDRVKVVFLMILTVFFMLFFALEMQLGSLFALFTARNVDSNLFGYIVPAAVSQAINPLAIIVFGPLVVVLFAKFGNKYAMLRMGVGLATMVLCFAILYLGCINASSNGLVAYGYLFVSICIMGVGELCIVPVIYNMFTTLSPTHLKGFLVGFLMLSLAFSNLAGIIVAKFMSIPTNGVEKLSAVDSLTIYQAGFLDLLYFNVYVLLAFALMYPLLQMLIKKKLV
jgi:POT family proton-dependent oligopeptide transporter